MSVGETTTLIVGSDESVTVRCDATHQQHPRWFKQVSPAAAATAAAAGDGDAGGVGVLVSVRRRLVLDAGSSRDGVYLCVADSSSTLMTGDWLQQLQLLAANITVTSPCTFTHTVQHLIAAHLMSCLLMSTQYSDYEPPSPAAAAVAATSRSCTDTYSHLTSSHFCSFSCLAFHF